MRRGLASVSFRYISILPLYPCIMYCDNKIKLKYGWQLTERNEWKLLNRLCYDSVTEKQWKMEGGKSSNKGIYMDFCAECCKLSSDECPNK